MKACHPSTIESACTLGVGFSLSKYMGFVRFELMITVEAEFVSSSWYHLV